MATFTVAAIQVAYDDVESIADRITRVSDLVRATAAEHAGLDLIVLPELWAPTGFDYERWESAAEPLGGPFTQTMSALATEIGVTLHAGSFVERLPEPGAEAKSLANTSLVLGADGQVLATYRKVHRFGFGSGEPKLMEAGRGRVVLPLPLQAGGSVMVGLATCYDLRFPELFRLLGEAGAEAFVVPAAWPLPRVAHWTLLGQARAIENQCAIIQVNTGGTHHNTVMGGNSQVVAAQGEVLGTIDGNGEAVLVATIDLAALADYRGTFPALADRRL
jgi:predicted amidohydrolase